MSELTTTTQHAEPNGDFPPTALEIVSTANLILNPEAFALIERFATTMAEARSTIPAHLKGNVGDCMAVTIQAMQWKMNPFAVAQKTHIINGTLGYEAQLVNAAITTMAPTKDRLHYKWFGPWEKIVGKFKTVQSKDPNKKDDRGNPKEYRVPDWAAKDEEGLGVKVWATMKGEDEPRELEILMTQARTRNSTLWADDPKQQIGYLASKRWARLYCPDVILGVYTRDELDEEARPTKDMGRADEVRPEAIDQSVLAEWEAVSKKGKKAATDFWLKLDPKIRKQSTQKQRDSMWAIAVEADKARTVDNGETIGTPPATSTAAPATDVAPATGETTSQETDDFVAEIERVEREQSGAS